MGRWIERGEFDDGARMERLDVAFADRYLDANAAAQDGLPTTTAWRTAFDAAGRNPHDGRDRARAEGGDLRGPAVPRGCVLCAVWAIVLAACAPERPPECEPLVDGVPLAANATSPEVVRTFRLEELWRRAGTREGEDLLLPITVVPAPGGRVAIPDFSLSEVSVVEADGTWRGAVTRTGDGPHEVRAPVAAAWVSDSVLRIFDIGRSRILAVDLDGRPAADEVALDPAFAAPVLARGELNGVALHAPAAPVLMTNTEATLPDGTFTDRMRGIVVRLDPSTSRFDTLSLPEWPTVLVPGWGDVAVPGWPRPMAAAADTLLAVAADDGSYRIVVYGAGGRPLRQVCRSVAPLPLTERELGEAGDAENAALVEAFGAAPRPEPPASIGRIVVTREGGLWVGRQRPSRLGLNEALWGVPGARLDVFDAAGAYLGEVATPGGARVQAVSGDRVWAFETGALDEVWLVAYRLIAE